MQNTIFRILLLLALVSCGGSQPDPEQQGQQMLTEVRTLYAQGNYSAARDSIMSLRQHYPTALKARRQAILLLDSVELQLAQGDSLKTEFYRRKLLHDKQELKD